MPAVSAAVVWRCVRVKRCSLRRINDNTGLSVTEIGASVAVNVFGFVRRAIKKDNI